jgi:hypothetical protein
LSEVDPQMGSCIVFIPESSPMKGAGKNGADIGANILYRYEDGILTDQALWDAGTGAFPCGAIVPGLNDVPGSSCFDVHQRLHVNANGCSLELDPLNHPPISYVDYGATDDSACFIATAAYGSSLEPKVMLLRRFRDRFLLKNGMGRAFVDFYYEYSPPIANFIAIHACLRAAARWALLPLINLSWVALHLASL